MLVLDYDNDGGLDVYVANDSSRMASLHNTVTAFRVAGGVASAVDCRAQAGMASAGTTITMDGSIEDQLR
jgi:hypothetical protein